VLNPAALLLLCALAGHVAVSLDEQRAAKQAVFQAMLEVPWAAEEGIPDSPMLGTQYAELLEAGG
jgi:hypothetical protein